VIYRVPPHVHHRALDDEVVVLDARADAYLGLNPTAAAAWHVLARGGSAAAAVEAIIAQFEIDAERATADLVDLIAELVGRGVLEPGPD
jgi:hypothetical protein